MSNRRLHTLRLLVFASAVFPLTTASAQSPPPAMDDSTCAQLANMPDAPISAESCRAMMHMGEDDPSSHRLDDEAMSCEQIFAELGTLQGEGVSDASAAETDSMIDEGRELSDLHTAEMARQAIPSPMALASSLLPNAVGAALMAPEQARTLAAMSTLKSADQRYSGKVDQHLATSAGEVGQLMDANPRLSRLSQLAIQKNCELPQD